MTTTHDLEQFKDLGAGRPAPAEVVRLYQQAFADFGALALRSSRAVPDPTIADALAIRRSCGSRATATPASSPNGSKKRAVPLFELQSQGH